MEYGDREVKERQIVVGGRVLPIPLPVLLQSVVEPPEGLGLHVDQLGIMDKILVSRARRLVGLLDVEPVKVVD